MTLPKRFINLVGTVTVLAVLAAGILLVALPVFLASFEVDAQRSTVAQSNDLRAAQIQALAAQQAKLPELEAELGDLRRQIPTQAALDSVSKLAVGAAGKAGVKLTSFDIGETMAFAPPTGVVDGAAAAAPPATGDASAAASDTAADPNAAPAGGERLQTQVSFTITASSVADGVRFVDELRQGSRLLQIIQATADSPADPGEPITAVVTALAFTKS